jgi:hypothetical protein
LPLRPRSTLPPLVAIFLGSALFFDRLASAYSGSLVIENFRRDPDQKLREPVWHRAKDGKNATEPSSIRADFDAYIHNLLTLGEDVLVSWANENLELPEMMEIAIIPEERRDPKNPAKYAVGPGPKLREVFTNLPGS